MDYYAYEYSVLMGLNDQLKIESINMNSDTYDMTKTIRNKYGQLENIVISRINIGRTIILNFTKDFHFSFDTNLLRKAYEQKYDAEILICQIVNDIKNTFLKEYIIR